MSGPALKYLAVLRPSAATSTLLYTAPAATSTVVSKLVITNDSATATTVFVSVVASGQSCAAKNSIVNAITIAGNDYVEVAQGVTLGTGDFICVQAVLATVNFNLFGQENS